MADAGFATEGILRSIRYDPLTKKGSVLDVVHLVTDCDKSVCSRNFANIAKAFPDILNDVEYHQFTGRGQRPTPVADLPTLFRLMAILPGSRSRRFVGKSMDVFTRVFAGDERLEPELKRRRTRLATAGLAGVEDGVTTSVEDALGELGRPLEPAVDHGVIYTATSPLVECVKVGFWTGSLDTLRSRYKMYYGTGLELRTWACAQCRAVECQLLEDFAAHSLGGELLDKACVPYLVQHIVQLLETVEVTGAAGRESTPLTTGVAQFNPEDILRSIRFDPLTKKGSVLDVVRLVTEHKKASNTLRNLLQTYPEIKVGFHQFTGQGQKPTPVADLPTLFQIMAILPGSRSRRFAGKSMDVFTRVFAGDERLEPELKKRRTQLATAGLGDVADPPLTTGVAQFNPEDILRSIRFDPLTKKGSVLDVVRLVTEHKKASNTLRNLLQTYPEIKVGFHQFTGQGQRPTPVADLPTLFQIMAILPGSRSRRFTGKSMDVFTRVFAGDEQLATAGLGGVADNVTTTVEDALGELGRPLEPAVDHGVIYAATSSLAECVKVGFWSGSTQALRSRYATYYGGELELRTWTCSQCREVERQLLEEFAAHSLGGELLDKACMPDLVQFLDTAEAT